jgi:hypothetical protein
MEAIGRRLESDARIAYALLFGSAARQSAQASSDVDIAIGLEPGAVLDVHEVGALVSDLESAAGRAVDVVLLDEAPPAVAYRVFRDGVVLLDRNHRALADRKARAILDYLDFRPLEAIAVNGALAAAARGR